MIKSKDSLSVKTKKEVNRYTAIDNFSPTYRYMQINKFCFGIIVSCFLVFLMTSCEETVYTPKPRGFPKVVFPEREYQPFNEDYCGFTFEYPKYAKVIKDTLFFDNKPTHPCWFDLYIEELNCRVHCSYVQPTKEDPLNELIEDAYEMVNKHNIKADYIDQAIISKPNNVKGVCFDVKGAVASNFQFYLTDSSEHFFRGSLYFNSKVQVDSVAPIAEFVKKDILHLVKTFAWEE